MKENTVNVIYYAIMFALYILLSKFGSCTVAGYSMGSDLCMITYALVFVVAMIGINYVIKRQKDNFTFEVSPARQCAGPSYLWGCPGSPKYEMCSNLSPEEVKRFSCGPGYNGGGEIDYQYTPESNYLWENTRCYN